MPAPLPYHRGRGGHRALPFRPLFFSPSLTFRADQGSGGQINMAHSGWLTPSLNDDAPLWYHGTRAGLGLNDR